MVILQSIHSKKWTVEQAESTVKATLFEQSLREPEAEGLPELRYGLIKAAIEEKGTDISDTTLSRALSRLVGKGELVKQEKGRETWYSLVLERPLEEYVNVCAKVDSMHIQGASRFGVIADLGEGWTFYGIPSSLGRRLRAKLRDEAMNFQVGVDNAIEREARRTIRAIVKKGKGRLKGRELKAAQEALWEIFDGALDAGFMAMSMAWVSTFLEGIAPGAMSSIVKTVVTALNITPDNITSDNLTDQQISYLARLAGEREDRFGRRITREVQSERKRREVIGRLFSSMRAKDREWAGRRYGELLALRTGLCAVVR